MNLRFYYLLPVLFATSHGFCEVASQRIDQLETSMAQISAENAFGQYSAKTASGAPQIFGSGLFLTADFLWWKLYEGATGYVIKDQSTSTELKGPIKHLNFNWEPGYKVGLGYLFGEDAWDLYLDFTSFKTHAHAKASSDFSSLLPLIGFESDLFSTANAHWHVKFYDIDWTLGRSYFVSRYLALHPQFGLTSAWIQQHRRLAFNDDSPVLKLRGKNNFWGIGPRLGMDAQFYLGRNFSVYGNVAGALLWGHFHVKEKEDNLFADMEVYDLHYNTQRMVPTVGFGLGLSYETNFSKDTKRFMVKAGYESQYWWRQNQFPILNLSTINFERESEDLSLQGLTVDFRFDF